jgi:hypothetical protein
MAVQAYYRWDAEGRPLKPAQPIRELVERLRIQFPRAAKANLFSWYADNAHYQANTPQDHTPFSVTGWPLPHPYPYVCATDVMHRPDLGVDCHKLFAYWIAEARAGRMPWAKYIIWRGQSYHVSRGWAPKAASGHFDHIHLSTRTDHINTSLGGWSIVPGTEEDDMTPDERREHWFSIWREKGMLNMEDPIVIPANPERGVLAEVREPNRLAQAIKALQDRPAAAVDAKAVAAELAKLAPKPLTKDETVAAAFEGAQRAEKE